MLLLPPSCAQPGAPTQLAEAWRSGTAAEAEAAEAAGAEAAGAEAAAGGLAEFPFVPSAALLRRIAAAGGFLFRLRPIRSERSGEKSGERSGEIHSEGGRAEGMNARGGGEAAEAVEAAEAAEERCLALFLPPGWLHWLVGDGAARPAAAALGSGAAPPIPMPHGAHGWHALFGGSFFPDCHEAHAARGSPGTPCVK